MGSDLTIYNVRLEYGLFNLSNREFESRDFFTVAEVFDRNKTLRASGDSRHWIPIN